MSFLLGQRGLATKSLNAIRNARCYGLAKTIRLSRTRLAEKHHDRRLDIHTSGYLRREELGHPPECNEYEPIEYQWIDTAFKFLKPEPGQDVVLDYGCGKGRAVVVAATHPVRRVIGVELSPELSEIARGNVRRAHKRLKCKNVDILTVDAVAYQPPPEVTVALLFNPFTGSILAAVQDRLRRSLEEAPRTLRIIYLHPQSVPNTFDGCQWLEKECELPARSWWTDIKIAAYRSKGVSSART